MVKHSKNKFKVKSILDLKKMRDLAIKDHKKSLKAGDDKKTMENARFAESIEDLIEIRKKRQGKK